MRSQSEVSQVFAEARRATSKVARLYGKVSPGHWPGTCQWQLAYSRASNPGEQGRNLSAFCDLAPKVTCCHQSWFSVGGNYTRAWLPGGKNYWGLSWELATTAELHLIFINTNVESWVILHPITGHFKGGNFCLIKDHSQELLNILKIPTTPPPPINLKWTFF